MYRRWRPALSHILSMVVIVGLLIVPSMASAGHDDVMRDFMEDEDHHERSMHHDRHHDADKHHDERHDKRHSKNHGKRHQVDQAHAHKRHRGDGHEGHGHWGRHMGGPMMKPGHMARLLAGMDLSRDQRKKIRKIHRAVRRENLHLMSEMMEVADQLYDLYAEERLDADRIGRVYEKMFSYRRQMIQKSIRALDKINKVLNPDQREKFRDLRLQDYGMMH